MSKLALVKTTLGIINNQNSNIHQMIIEAHRAGLKVGVYSTAASSMVKGADFVVVGRLDDSDKLKRFATRCQWVVYIDGDGISDSLINELKRYTNVPQGTELLDIINDRSIQRVFLNSLHVKLRPYEMVFSLSDVKQAIDQLGYPLALQPVQTNYLQDHEILITQPADLDGLKTVFNGESYILESLPKKARYLHVTVVKSQKNSVTLPIIEDHYKGQSLDFAGVTSQLSSGVAEALTQSATLISDQLNYVGSLTLSFVLTDDRQLFVDGVGLPFNWAGNVFNLTRDNEYQMFFRALMNARINSVSLRQSWLIKAIDHRNLVQAQKLWINNRPVWFNVNPLVESGYSQAGYAILSAPSVQKAVSELRDDRL